ncbi:MAG: cyclic nucleotide-binding domain-containing protein, partial [Myxococcales bacterium]|nr:cyclic nucleotide-binding domain-containing protein [Myxococcales bacterium]
IIGHVGDSRLYMIRGQKIYQVTEDHTLLRELQARGALSDEEAKAFPHRNVLSRSVGRGPTINVDSLLVDVVPGDKFIICSDGLSDLVGPDEILRIAAPSPPQDAVRQLIATANQNGGKDNISVIVIEATGEHVPRKQLRTEQKADFLKEVFLFKSLSFPEMVRVLRAVREFTMNAGEVVIREGEYGDELYILVDGQVDVTQAGVYLTTIKPGNHFGELGLVGEGVRTATVTARTNVTLLGVRRHDFFQLVNADHNMAVQLLWGFVQNLAGRMKSLSAEVTRHKKEG